ncbi:MAG: outer membrane lipoprotein carrier protein LolA [Bacteroidales bacterium]|nr:outer membrane lipoprotein carrier protein LolA [Bacteroidales bacterium]
MKPIYLSGIIVVFVFVLNQKAFSQSLPPATEAQKKEITSRMQSAAASTNTMECKFSQKKTISVLSETVVSEGIMYFKKENKLRWQYEKPYSYIFILNEGKVYIKNDGRTTSFDTNSNKIFREISEIMIGGVRGSLLLDNKKFSTQYYMGSNKVAIKLIPQNSELKNLISAINLTVSSTDWLVQSIELVEKGGDVTIITFTEKNVNKSIADTLFSLN